MTTYSGRPRLPVDASLLREVFDKLGAAVYVVGAEGVVQAFNPLAERLTGYPEGVLQGRRAHGLLHHLDPDGHPRREDECRLLRAAAAGVPDSCPVDVFVRADGTLLPVSWDAAPIVGDEDEPAGAVVVFRDRSSEAARDAELASAMGARDAAAAESHDNAFVARVTRAITTTLDLQEAVRRLGRLLVPTFADWCLVDLVVDGRVQRVATVHRDPAEMELPPADVGPPVPPADDHSVINDVLRGGPTRLVQGNPVAPAEPSELHRQRIDLAGRWGMDSAIVAGLRARRRVLGAVTVVRSGSGRSFGRRDVELAEHLADQAAVALDNIRLYTEQRSTAEALQHNLLPDLPELAGLELCATYEASSTSTEVGGDWYDVVPLDADRTALVLGDLAGHDLQAAVNMSTVRTLLRAASLDSDQPAAILAATDRAMDRFTPGVTATAVVAVIDRSGSGPARLHWSSAGHLPPLLVDGAGARYVEAPADVMLGAAPDLPRATHSTSLAPDTTVVLYTDGLVERRDDGVEPGLERLRQAAARLGPSVTCDDLVGAMGSAWDDDVALIAATLGP